MAVHWTEHIWLYRALIVSRDKGVSRTAVQTEGLEGGCSCHCWGEKGDGTMQNRAQRWKQTNKQINQTSKRKHPFLPSLPPDACQEGQLGSLAQAGPGSGVEAPVGPHCRGQPGHARRAPGGGERSKTAVRFALKCVVSVRNPH